MPDESSPHSSLRVLRPILKLSFHLHLYLPNDLCHTSLQIRTWYLFHIFPTCATCPTHLILLDLIIVMFYREYKSQSFSLRSFLSSTIFLLLYPYITSTSFSNTLSRCSLCLFVCFSYCISRFLLSFVSRVTVSLFSIRSALSSSLFCVFPPPLIFFLFRLFHSSVNLDWQA